VGLSVMFPRQRVCPILPGVRSFLNFAGMSKARSGIWRSPMTRTRREVILGGGFGCCGFEVGGSRLVTDKL